MNIIDKKWIILNILLIVIYDYTTFMYRNWITSPIAEGNEGGIQLQVSDACIEGSNSIVS